MSRFSGNKQSLCRGLSCVIFAVSCLNVYLFCMYLDNEDFYRSDYLDNKKSLLRVSDVSQGTQEILQNTHQKRRDTRQVLEGTTNASHSNITVLLNIGNESSQLGVARVTERRQAEIETVEDSGNGLKGKCVPAALSARRSYLSTLRTIVNPLRVNVTLGAWGACGGGATPYVLVVVLSKTPHFKERRVIRATWASYEPVGSRVLMVQTVFVVGRAESDQEEAELKAESERHGDLLQGDFREEYSAITHKVVLAMAWMTSGNCRDASFFVKVDEDVYVDLKQLLLRLNFIDIHPIVMGYSYLSGPVFREGNWGVSLAQYKFCHYLPYVEGNSYVISGSLVSKLLNASQYHPYMATEDAYITGILREMIGAKLQSNKGQFAAATKRLNNVNRDSVVNFFQKGYISETRCTMTDMSAIWKVFKELLEAEPDNRPTRKHRVIDMKMDMAVRMMNL